MSFLLIFWVFNTYGQDWVFFVILWSEFLNFDQRIVRLQHAILKYDEKLKSTKHWPVFFSKKKMVSISPILWKDGRET